MAKRWATGVVRHHHSGEQGRLRALVGDGTASPQLAAFDSPSEYRVVAEGRALGAISPSAPVVPGGLLIFAGRRWKIRKVDAAAKLIELTPSSRGRPPMFGGAGPDVHGRMRMRLIYQRGDMPAYLDSGAQQLLGDTIMTTLGLALQQRGICHEDDGLALCLVGTTPDQAAALLADLAAAPSSEPQALAALVPDKTLDKYDDVLGDELRAAAYAARKIDIPGTWAALIELSAAAAQARPTTRPVHAER